MPPPTQRPRAAPQDSPTYGFAQDGRFASVQRRPGQERYTDIHPPPFQEDATLAQSVVVDRTARGYKEARACGQTARRPQRTHGSTARRRETTTSSKHAPLAAARRRMIRAASTLWQHLALGTHKQYCAEAQPVVGPARHVSGLRRIPGILHLGPL